MKLGLPTLIDYENIYQHANLCKDCGYDFIELNLTFPWLQKGKIDIDQLNEVQKQYGIFYTIHLHDQLDPVNFCEEIRNAGICNIMQAIKTASKLGVTNLTMHLNVGMYSSRKSGKVYLCDMHLDEYLGHVRDFVDTVGPELSKRGITLCIENTTGFVDAQRRAIELMLEHPNFALTFDIGHSYKSTCGCDEQFILQHQDKLKHFHIHDVTPSSNHIALGEGVIDLPKYFTIAKSHNCTVVIEVKEGSALVTSMQYIRTNIK